jgi:hypothetical protein
MKGLPIEHVHALRVASLPAHHQDPFDRLIVAQSQIEKETPPPGGDVAIRPTERDVFEQR